MSASAPQPAPAGPLTGLGEAAGLRWISYPISATRRWPVAPRAGTEGHGREARTGPATDDRGAVAGHVAGMTGHDVDLLCIVTIDWRCTVRIIEAAQGSADVAGRMSVPL